MKPKKTKIEKNIFRQARLSSNNEDSNDNIPKTVFETQIFMLEELIDIEKKISNLLHEKEESHNYIHKKPKK
ncbi:MAG: hypothetical protein WAT79_11025 [Saprospiraceae bacterium]